MVVNSNALPTVPVYKKIELPHYFASLILLIDFSLTVKAATLLFISGRGLANLSSIKGKSGSIYKLGKN